MVNFAQYIHVNILLIIKLSATNVGEFGGSKSWSARFALRFHCYPSVCTSSADIRLNITVVITVDDGSYIPNKSSYPVYFGC